MAKKGLLIVLSGPSGVGKGTIRRELFKDKSLNLTFSISVTTRKPRKKEKDGVDYFFISKAEFEQKLKEGKLLEHVFFVGNYYGTPKEYVDELRNQGKNVFLEIEVEGAKQVMSKCNDEGFVSIFLLPPSLSELERRIRGRKSESEAIIQERLAKAKKEMNLKCNYQHVILNDNVKKATRKIAAIIKNKMKSLD